ncbi:MAG: acetyl-CoA carboxylase, carboxyltransferase subunit beta [Candidatus Omnitrophica bacterium]|jgi:acetyl-CoA carboxylase carboxyl transferase subunit beta|nr:acetyl-CoA carboxylase, carboxyltransferase subunit beta [Candidatus Omnitrophota bacterium]
MFGKPKYTIVKVAKKKEIPEGLWTKCEDCGDIIYNKALEENMKVCPKCNYHFVLTAPERIAMLLDEGSFEERDGALRPMDPLLFKGPRSYEDKLKEDQLATGLTEACISGRGSIEGKRVILVVTDSRFIMGSMGSVVGEKIARATELATNLRLPLVIVSGSGGGARMYEGLFSLMQMAKTSAAIAKLHEAGVPYISVLTNPTMAGIMASFASLGDVIVAEPKALIGFTGPRVIEQTIRQKLPPGFQRSEFLLEHGLLDMIMHRKSLKPGIAQLIEYLT